MVTIVFTILLLIATECVLKFTKYPEKKENYENEITKYQNILCATIVLIDSRLWLNTQSKTMSMYYIVLYLL